MKLNSKKLYFDILRIRMVEEEIARKYQFQKMRCPVHLSVGQEAVPVGISSNLVRNDKIVTAHRSHAHYLAKGGNLNSMISELHGKSGGCAKGKGGSMHLIDLDAGVQAAVPIVGSTIPIGVGVAWGQKLNRSKNICVIFFGDGATEEGVFLESLDFAALNSLPVLFVCEDNHYSVYSSKSKRQSYKRDIIKIASSLGIEGVKLDGNDVLKISRESKKIIKKIKKNSQPKIMVFETYRHLEHCGPNNDNDLGYRSKKYINFWLNKCPVKTLERFLIKKKLMTTFEIKNYRNKINNEIIKAFNYSKRSKFPKKIELFKDIYA